ncbi:hypothetical protein A2U01_0098562, partial [Trifolium medium]|nr:hypothetical protein [Trifolium medium]
CAILETNYKLSWRATLCAATPLCCDSDNGRHDAADLEVETSSLGGCAS